MKKNNNNEEPIEKQLNKRINLNLSKIEFKND